MILLALVNGKLTKVRDRLHADRVDLHVVPVSEILATSFGIAVVVKADHGRGMDDTFHFVR